MRKSIGRVVFIALLVTASASFAETTHVRFERLGVADGLPQAAVTAITQDRSGFMWFGTQEGLARYDGYSFSTYRHDSRDASSLSHDMIRALAVDRQGQLWIATDGGGLNRYLAQTNTFERYRHDDADPTSLGSDRVRTLLIDSRGKLWIGSDGGGLATYLPESNSFRTYTHDPGNPLSLSGNNVRALHETAEGRIYVATETGGLDWMTANGPGVFYSYDGPRADDLTRDEIRSLRSDHNGFLWIGTFRGGLYRLDLDQQTLDQFDYNPAEPGSLGNNRVRALLHDSRAHLWIATDDGIHRYDPNRRKFDRFKNDPTDPYSLSDPRVLSLFQDDGGVVWAGTYAGLSRFNPNIGGFGWYATESLSSPIVTSFAEGSNGDIWIGTYGGGLNQWQRTRDTFAALRHEAKKPGSLSDDRVMSLAVSRTGDLWVGTFAGGLNRLRPGSTAFEHYRYESENRETLGADAITSLIEDRRGHIWVGTYGGGLNQLDPKTGRVTRYQHSPEDASSIGSDRVVALTFDSDEVLWIGTDGGGLQRFELGSGHFTRIAHDPNYPGGLTNDQVMALHHDAAGDLWIGTQGGLNRWPRALRKDHRVEFEQLTYREGLPSSAVHGITSDQDGRIWISTNRGLSRLDPESRTLDNFGPADGLQGNDFTTGAYLRLESGELLFGGAKGLNLFHPRGITQNNYVPPVVVSAGTKLQRSRLLCCTDDAEPLIELSYGEYMVNFEFAALDYTRPQENLFRYRLEGFEQDWVESGSRRYATYTNLPAGNYILRVQAANGDGVWNREGATVTVRVAPAPWATWWAKALYALALLVLAAVYVKTQAQRRQRAKHLEATNVRLENEIAERVRAQAELTKLSLAVEQSPASVIIASPDGSIEYVNPKFEMATGYRSSEVLGKRFEDFASGQNSGQARERLWMALRAGRDWRSEVDNRRKDGELFWESSLVSPIFDDDGQLAHVLVVNEDITVRKEYEDQLLRQASIDPLTDLPNRLLVMDRMSTALSMALRRQEHTAVFFVDLDNFKIINDTLGHAIGDELLRAASRRLAAVLREGDTVGRFGGDEFVIIVPELKSPTEAEIAAGRILSCFAKPFSIADREVFVTASIGVTVSPDDGIDAHVLLRNADAAMYRSKELGRDGYQFFTNAMNEHANRRLQIESSLRQALDRNELKLHFQPIISAEGRTVFAAEALMRWETPELGNVPPTEFIPVAEETGLIVSMGSWAIQQVCDEAVKWHHTLGSWVGVSVNVSARQLRDGGFAGVVEQALEVSGLPPEHLILEMTERLLLEDTSRAGETLRQLHAMGVKLSIDDFGTGYSALSYLKSFPFDYLKIDRSFIRDLTAGNRDEGLVAAIVSMCRSLGLMVTAEGVENEHQLELLEALGCNSYQGYVFTRPLTADRFLDWLLRAVVTDAPDTMDRHGGGHATSPSDSRQSAAKLLRIVPRLRS